MVEEVNLTRMIAQAALAMDAMEAFLGALSTKGANIRIVLTMNHEASDPLQLDVSYFHFLSVLL